MVCILPFLQKSVTSQDGFFLPPIKWWGERQMTFQINQLLLSRILISSLVYKHECDLSKRNDGTMQSANISNPCIHIA